MLCALCQKAKGRRHCPALGSSICPVCCGTKRHVEIQCPPGCGYLSAAREHPAAAVQKRTQQQLALLGPTLRGLNERQHRLYFLLHSTLAERRAEGAVPPLDADLAEAAAAAASALERAGQGRAPEPITLSPSAQLVAAAFGAALQELLGRQATTLAEAAATLRAVELGALEFGKGAHGDTAYLDLMALLMEQGSRVEPATPPLEPPVDRDAP